MPSVKRDLQATADLLEALQKDPTLLQDGDFIKRLSILRKKHEETTNFLAKKLEMTSSKNSKNSMTSQFATSSEIVEESFLSTVREEEKPETPVFRAKSEQNLVQLSTTVPKPFKLSLRTSTGNTYAKKFMSDLMEEKRKKEEMAENQSKTVKFRAKPVPKSTYLPTNTFATELKYLEAMRKKVEKSARKKFEAQTEMVRSKSETNLAKPLGYVPPTTYISPIPVRPNARSRSAVSRSALMIKEATTPKGIKSHLASSNLTHQLRHGRCKLDISELRQNRRTSPPDFQKIHEKITSEFRKLGSKPSTVPIPFSFAVRSKSAVSRHSNCREKPVDPFKKSISPKIDNSEIHVANTVSAQLRKELNQKKIQKMAEISQKNDDFLVRKKIDNFLGKRSKTDEEIAIRTRRKKQLQQETTQEYMRKLAEMKQRVLNGPLIMEKQSALAQEHRLRRKFEKAENLKKSKISRRNSETSAAGTFIVEKSEVSEVSEKSETSENSSESESDISSDDDN